MNKLLTKESHSSQNLYEKLCLLAIMKLNLGRERDLNDGFALLDSGKCDTGRFTAYMTELKNALEDYDSIAQYEKLIAR